MTKHFSSRYYYYLVLSTVCLLATIAFRRVELLALASPFVVAVLLSFLRQTRPEISIRHVVRNANVFEGERIQIHLSVQATTDAPLLEILQPLPAGMEVVEGTNDNIVSLRAGEHRGIVFELLASRRGRPILGGLVARVHSADGFTYWESRIDPFTNCVVYPNPEHFRQPVRPFNTQVYSGNYPSRVGGEGIEFSDTKPFAPGVPVSRINWRITARTRTLHVNEFVQERNADIVLLLDAYSDFGASPHGCVDYVARCAASLAQHFLVHKNRVGCVELGYFFKWVLPATGMRQWYRILEHLTDLEVRTRHVTYEIDSVPRRLLPTRALVLAITSGLDNRFVKAAIDLERRGYDVVAVVVPAHRILKSQLPDTPNMRIALRMWRRSIDLSIQGAREAGLAVLTWDIHGSMELLVRSVEAVRRRRVRAS